MSISDQQISFHAYTGLFEQSFSVKAKSNDNGYARAIEIFNTSHCRNNCPYFFDERDWTGSDEHGNPISGTVTSACSRYSQGSYDFFEQYGGEECEAGHDIPAEDDDYDDDDACDYEDDLDVAFVFTSRYTARPTAPYQSRGDYYAALCNADYNTENSRWYTSAQLRGCNVDSGFHICFGGADAMPSLKSAAATYLDSTSNEDYIDIPTFQANVKAAMDTSHDLGSLTRPIPTEQIIISSTEDQLYDGFLFAHRHGDEQVFQLLKASGIPPFSADWIIAPIRHHIHTEGDHAYAGFITEPGPNGMCWFIDNNSADNGTPYYALIATIPAPSPIPA